jgi:signal transduction histidine kinase
MRRMLGVLREEPAPAGPNGAERPPLSPQPGLRDLDALVERVGGTGLSVSVERSGRPFEVSGAAGLTAYRIVQEALTNALKHAEEPDSVVVQVTFEDPDLSVRVTDDGRTKVAAPVAGPGGGGMGGGHGLAGMAERAAAFGGTLHAGPRSAGGWEVSATLRDCKAPTSPTTP